MTPRLESLLSATYVSTSKGEQILRKLTRAAGFTSENVIARLAVSRSLQDPPIEWSDELNQDTDGKQLRGNTLLGRQEVAAALLAMIYEAHRADSPTIEDVRQLVRLHLDRGLRLLDADIGDGDVEDLFLRYAAGSLSDGSPISAASAVSPLAVVQSQVVGQQRLKRQLSTLLTTAVTHTPARFNRVVGLVGPDGFGRAHVARSIAQSFQLPMVEFDPADCNERFPDLLGDRLAVQGYATEIRRDQLVVPACIIYFRDAGLLEPDVYEDLRRCIPRARPIELFERRVRLLGGGLLLGASHLPADSTRTDLTFESYTRDEVAEIIRRVMGGWPLEIRRHLALAGRLTPGTALRLAQEFQAEVRTRGANARPSETLLLAMMEGKWGIDRLGLTQDDYAFLNELATTPISQEGIQQNDLLFMTRLRLIRATGDSVALTDRGAEALRAKEAQ